MVSSTFVESTDLESRASLFGALGDPIRVQILDLLSISKQCVCELQRRIDIAPNLLSYHLRILREVGLVVSSRRGRWVDYRLEDDASAMMSRALPGQHVGDTTT